MIIKKEFYFVRHGQTDYNILEGKDKGDHPADISLNRVGREQAMAIIPTIALLPVKTVCVSPMRRAQETKAIITEKLELEHHNIDNLRECSFSTWKGMARLGMYSSLPEEGEVRLFMERVRDGLNQALSLPGPCLIVAHGGIHWATCCLMRIKDHEWLANNCAVVHFSIDQQNNWTAKKLL